MNLSRLHLLSPSLSFSLSPSPSPSPSLSFSLSFSPSPSPSSSPSPSPPRPLLPTYFRLGEFKSLFDTVVAHVHEAVTHHEACGVIVGEHQLIW